jgi:cell fate regulator YaaT (PSP1 superfamily)
MTPFDVVEVRFKGTRKEFYRNVHNHDITLGEMVVVEMENGYDIGHVATKGEMCKLQLRKAGLSEDGDFRKINRKANDADIARYNENKELEVPTMYKARSISMELGLSMKLSDVEYQGDRRKATFYYTAEDRVDFRELIRKLADSFKVRVEMRQIGYRQEAGRLGAIGSCGRELCCSTWLTDFKLVQTSAARYQNLSLNPLKLSGQCGRLKCCLNFELDAYMEAWKEFPSEDNIRLEFATGTYKSVKTDILKKVMWFMPLDVIGGEWINLPVNKVKEYRELNKQGEKPELEFRRPVPKVVEFEFKNDMGTESLTRLDERSKPKNKNKNRNNKNKNKGPQGGENRQAAGEGQNKPQQNQQPRGNNQPREPRPEQQNRNINPAEGRKPREPRPEGQNKPQQNQRPRENNQPREPRSEGQNKPQQNQRPRENNQPRGPKPEQQNKPQQPKNNNQGEGRNNNNQQPRGPRPDRQNRPPRDESDKPTNTPPPKQDS